MEFFTAFSTAISEVSGLLKILVAGKEVARLKYRAEAAVNYVFVDEESGEYAGITEKRKKQMKLHFRKQIFDIN